MRTKTYFLLLSLVFVTTIALAQDQSQLTQSQEDSRFILKRAIAIDEQSQQETIVIPIDSETLQFELNIQSTISKGKLMIEFYDPKGNKKGNFSIVTQMKSSGSERVSGDLSKQIKDPLDGEWTIQIIPLKVNGEILITTGMISK